MKSMAIVACAAVGLWSCTAVVVADTTSAAAAPNENGGHARDVQSPSLDEMTRVVEAQEHLTSAAYDLIGWIASGTPKTDDDLTVQGRGKKPKPGQMAMAMLGTAAMSTMMMKSVGAIMMFMVHSFFATKLGLILAAYLLVCKLSEMKSAPPKKVIKWSSPPSSSYDEQPPQMMLAGGPYPDSQQSSYADPLQQDLLQQQPPPQQQQQQPSGQYGAPSPQQQYGAPAQQYMAPGDFGGGGGGDFMQAHFSNLSPVTYRPPINKLAVVENAAKSLKAGRL